MCSTDLDASDVWEVTTVVARKRHKCSECYLPIPVGCRHLRIGSLFEGSWETIRQHVECDAVAEFVRKHICEAHGEHGFIPVGGLGEEIRNLGDYGPEMLSPGEADELAAIGVELTEWEPEGDDRRRVDLAAIADWLWDLAKAPYQEAA